MFIYGYFLFVDRASIYSKHIAHNIDQWSRPHLLSHLIHKHTTHTRNYQSILSALSFPSSSRCSIQLPLYLNVIHVFKIKSTYVKSSKENCLSIAFHSKHRIYTRMAPIWTPSLSARHTLTMPIIYIEQTHTHKHINLLTNVGRMWHEHAIIYKNNCYSIYSKVSVNQKQATVCVRLLF